MKSKSPDDPYLSFLAAETLISEAEYEYSLGNRIKSEKLYREAKALWPNHKGLDEKKFKFIEHSIQSSNVCGKYEIPENSMSFIFNETRSKESFQNQISKFNQIFKTRSIIGQRIFEIEYNQNQKFYILKKVDFAVTSIVLAIIIFMLLEISVFLSKKIKQKHFK
ncbi:hypothetical protein EHQ46_16110 [Leptospira yanagawae]|uniref:Tetratricopeptide repeat protein n=1 Tax=Leptospira yanagawae TaxID=293069 RepID=A0ABY2LXV6_9LEPT|nr:hypothetical protein [Leptospira yanagawae]TGL17711.1 hypothetical protein EHQ46_16110 [Leptospira yanagawae]